MKCHKCNGDLELNNDAVITQEFRGERLQVHSPAFQCIKCKSHFLRDKQGDELRRRTALAFLAFSVNFFHLVWW
jgi:Zn finger protein HypA/HybF involved in hydrogenase expression